MPGVPHAPPPPFFDDLCARWADGRATPYDAAVLTALTTNTALADPHDPQPVGFLPTTRLPPPATAHLFHEAKNAARARHHAAATAAAAAALHAALTDPAPPLFATPPPPPTLSAAPARLGALHAARRALGAPRAVRWTVTRPVLAAAGPSFVHFLRGLGWQPQPMVDIETGLSNGSTSDICFVSDPGLSDRALLRGALALARGPRAHAHVVPAGSPSWDAPRDRAARTGPVVRAVLRARLLVGTLLQNRVPLCGRVTKRARAQVVTPM